MKRCLPYLKFKLFFICIYINSDKYGKRIKFNVLMVNPQNYMNGNFNSLFC